MLKRVIQVLVFLVVLGLASTFMWQIVGSDSSATSTADLAQEVERNESGLWGVRLAEPVSRPTTNLIDTHGSPVDLATDYHDKGLLIFTGFTNCPDICPVTLSTVARAFEKVGMRIGREIDVIFIGIDPQRDTPEAVRNYLDKFDTEMVGLTGTREELDKTSDGLGLPRAVIDDSEKTASGNYAVGHSGQTIYFDPNGGDACYEYPFGIRTVNWVDDLPKLAQGVCDL